MIQKQRPHPNSQNYGINLIAFSEIRMTELTSICEGFFFSARKFFIPGVSNIVAKRFFELLQTGHYQWDDNQHGLLKTLYMSRYQDSEDMRSLTSALDTCGFFEYCEHRQFNGLHDVHSLLRYLIARNYRDERLLSKCAAVFDQAVKDDMFTDRRSKDVSRSLLYFAQLGFRLDARILQTVIEYYRDLCLPIMKESFGVSLLQFLDAASLNGVYPRDIIDAFFRSDLVQVQRGNLPGMTGQAAFGNPWEDLLRFDEMIGILLPDYDGARLPKRTVDVARKFVKSGTPTDDDLAFAVCLDDAISKVLSPGSRQGGGRKGSQFVSIDDHSSLLTPQSTRNDEIDLNFVLKLDQNNRPISTSNKSFKFKGKNKKLRQISIQLLRREHYLLDPRGELTLKPEVKRFHECLAKLGFEVVVVGFRRRQASGDAAVADKVVRDILKQGNAGSVGR